MLVRRGKVYERQREKRHQRNLGCRFLKPLIFRKIKAIWLELVLKRSSGVFFQQKFFRQALHKIKVIMGRVHRKEIGS